MLHRDIFTVVQLLSRTVALASRTAELENWDDYNRAIDRIYRIMETAPNGNGLVTRKGSVRYSQGRLSFEFSYHHMINGMYTEWTDHTLIAIPSLEYGYSIKITGRNRHGIIGQLEPDYDMWLSSKIEHVQDTDRPEWEGIVPYDPHRAYIVSDLMEPRLLQESL